MSAAHPGEETTAWRWFRSITVLLAHCTACMLCSSVPAVTFHLPPLPKNPGTFPFCTWMQLQNICMINVCCWRDKVCSSMDKWERIDHFILFAISKFNIPLESISEIESILFFCVPACSLFLRSKIHFWLITNALGSWRANVFVECQLMLSDKCLKLSQGSCPSFRLCQMSPLVEEDNSYTGGDWAVCSQEGLTLPYGAVLGWKKHGRCFNGNLRNLSLLPFLPWDPTCTVTARYPTVPALLDGCPQSTRVSQGKRNGDRVLLSGQKPFWQNQILLAMALRAVLPFMLVTGWFCVQVSHISGKYWLMALTKDAQQCCPTSIACSRSRAELISSDLSP